MFQFHLETYSNITLKQPDQIILIDSLNSVAIQINDSKISLKFKLLQNIQKYQDSTHQRPCKSFFYPENREYKNP